MTITTAKLVRSIRLAYAPPLALTALLVAGSAHGQDALDQVRSGLESLEAPKPSANSWRIVPMIDLRQIYTDNVNLQPDERAHSQFLTELAPGVQVKHASRRLKLDGTYQMHLYANAHDEQNTRRSSHNLLASAKAELLDELLFVDASASIFQQSISPFGQAVSDNDYASANRAKVKTWQVSPYLLNRFGRVAKSELRYRRDAVDAGDSGLRSTDGDTLSAKLSNGTAFTDLGWSLAVSQQQVHYERSNDSNIKAASANLSYQLRPSLRLAAGLVYDDYDYQAIGGANGGKGWEAGVRWTPSRRTDVAAMLGHRYYGPSRNLKASHRSRNSTWNLSYDDAVVTSRSNFLLPGETGPGNLPPALPADLGGLTPSETIPPLTGPVVPVIPGLPTNINFFSNRYSLQKQLRANVTVQGGRSSAVLALFKIRRQALSERGIDDDLQGTPIDTVNDNLSQTGVNANLSYRIKSRTTLNLAADVTDNESLTTGTKARSQGVRLILRHQLGRKMAASGELRRVSGATGLTTGARYTENAVSVSLNIKL